MIRRRSALLVLPLVVGGLVACGGGGDSESGSDAFCTPMEELADYNAQAPQPDITGDWETVKSDLLASAESARPLYDDAIAEAPEAARGYLETLKDYTDEILVAVEESESAEDFVSAFGAPSQAVLTATEELDTYIQETCGFGLTQSG